MQSGTQDDPAYLPQKRQKQISNKPRTNQMTNEVTKQLREILKKHKVYLRPATGSKWTWQQLYSMVQSKKLEAAIPPDVLEWVLDNLSNNYKKRPNPATNTTTSNTISSTINNENITDPYNYAEKLLFENNTSIDDYGALPYDDSVPNFNNPSPPVDLSPNSTSSLPNTPVQQLIVNSPPVLSSSILPSTPLLAPLLPPSPIPLNPSPQTLVSTPQSLATSPDIDFSLEDILQEDISQDAAFRNLNANEIKANLVQALDFLKLSDVRTKENIREISATDALEKARHMIVYLYKYKKEHGGDGSEEYGFLAQQLQSLSPKLVKEQESGLLTIKTTDILALLAGSIRALADANDSLHEKIARMNIASCAPMRLAYFEGEELVVNSRALEVVRSVTTTISVVGVCGQKSDGNSTLCNHLLQSKEKERYFKTDNSTEPCTLGIWMSYPVENQLSLILDSQGFDISDKGVQVLTFLCLISNVIILCQRMAVTNTLLDNLNTIVEVHKTFKNLQIELPSLIMLIKDAQFQMDKKKNTGDHFLYRTLDTLGEGSRYKACSEVIPQFQPNTVMELPRPDDAEFLPALDALRACVARYSRGRKYAHGAALAQRIDACADAMRRDLPHASVPSFAKLVECRELASSLFASYEAGKIPVSSVLRMFELQTLQVPKEFREKVISDLRTKVDTSELLRIAARIESYAG